MQMLLSALLSLIFLFTPLLNSDETETLLIRKWKVDTEATRNNIEKSFHSDKATATDTFSAAMVEEMMEIFDNTIIEYKAGGEFINTISEKEEGNTLNSITIKGNWKLSENKKEIHLSENKKITKISIISISAEKMILAYPGTDSNQRWVIVFIPA